MPYDDAAEHEQVLADVFARGCPSRDVLEHVTGRWGILALAALASGPARFNALRRRVDGVSEKMLSQTLHALERDGFVRRDEQSTIPPRVEYSLTDRGDRTTKLLLALIDQVEADLPEAAESQRRYDEARAGRQG